MTGKYYFQILGNVQSCRTEAEIYFDQDPYGMRLAVVYDSPDGWTVEFSPHASSVADAERLEATIAGAKEELSHYVNRLGHGAPEGIAPVGLSLWLLLKDDGTALGKPIDWE